MNRRDGGLGRVGCLLLGLVVGCGGGNADPDATVAGDGKICVPQDHRVCDSGNAFWADDCANLGELIEECSVDKPCDDAVGSCCFPAQTTGTFAEAPVLARLDLVAGAASAELALELELVTFALLGQAQAYVVEGTIEGRHFSISARADLAESGDAFGPGLSFMGAVQSEDISNVEYASPVFFDSSPEMGGLVRLSRPIDLVSRTQLGLRLTREDSQGEGDWFALYVVIDAGAEEQLGRILFPRQGGTAGQIEAENNSMSGLVIRDNEFSLADVGKVQVASSIPTFDGEPASSALLSYPVVAPAGLPFPNVDVRYEPSIETITLTQGGVTSNCREAGELF